MRLRFVHLLPLIVLAVAIITLQSCQRQTGKPVTTAPKPEVAKNVPPSSNLPEARRSDAAKKPDKPAEKVRADVGKPSAKGKQPGAKPTDSQKRVRLAQRANAMKLMLMVVYISQAERTQKFALTDDQAKKVLAILTPLRSKPKLTDEEAGRAVVAMRKVLSADQLGQIDKLLDSFSNRAAAVRRLPKGVQGGKVPDNLPSQRVEFRTVGKNPQGQPPPPGAPPQGGPRPGTNMRGPGEVERMRDFNPFYSKAPKDDPQMGRRVEHMDQFFDILKQKAK